MSSGVQGGPTANIYQAHSLRKAVSELGVLSPQAFASVVSTAQQAFLDRVSQLASDRYDDTHAVEGGQLDDMPQLAAPKEQGASSSSGVSANGKVGAGAAHAATGAAALTEVFGQLMALIGANSVQQLQQNAQIWNSVSNAVKSELEQLSGDVDAANKAAKDATGAAGAADQDATKAEAAQRVADQAAQDADAALKKAKDRGASPDEIDKLKKDADKKHSAADAADAVAKTKRSTADTKTKDASTATDKAIDAENKANAAVDNVKQQFGSGSALAAHGEKRHLSGAAALTAVLGELQDLIAKSNVEELDTKQKLYHEMQVKREEAAQKKSDEYQEQVKKAEEMQKTMGCIGKIVGWLVTIVSVVAAWETGGASLALAAVGVALMAGDEICQAATGTSFMEQAMQPFMDAILKPMMNFFASAVTKALQACGVSSDEAKLAGAIIGAIVTAVVVVAAVVVGSAVAEGVMDAIAPAIKNAIDKVMDSGVGKEVVRMVEEIIEKLGVEEMMEVMSKGMTRLGSAVGVNTAEDAEKMATRMEMGAVALGVGNEVVQTAGSIVVGLKEKAAMEALAAVKMALADIKALGTMIKDALEAFAAQNRVLSQLMQEMSDASQTEASAGALVLRNARAV
jgi:invasin B